jgi:hypothetical protein
MRNLFLQILVAFSLYSLFAGAAEEFDLYTLEPDPPKPEAKTEPKAGVEVSAQERTRDVDMITQTDSDWRRVPLSTLPMEQEPKRKAPKRKR